jgi:hypothetical protein
LGKHILKKSLGVGPMWKKGRRGTRSGGNFWGRGRCVKRLLGERCEKIIIEEKMQEKCCEENM